MPSPACSSARRQVETKIVAGRYQALPVGHDPSQHILLLAFRYHVIQNAQDVRMLAEDSALRRIRQQPPFGRPAARVDPLTHVLQTSLVRRRNCRIAERALQLRCVTQRAHHLQRKHTRLAMRVECRDRLALRHPVHKIPVRRLAQQSVRLKITGEPRQHIARALQVLFDDLGIRPVPVQIVQHADPQQREGRNDLRLRCGIAALRQALPVCASHQKSGSPASPAGRRRSPHRKSTPGCGCRRRTVTVPNKEYPYTSRAHRAAPCAS